MGAFARALRDEEAVRALRMMECARCEFNYAVSQEQIDTAIAYLNFAERLFVKRLHELRGRRDEEATQT